MGFIDDYLSDPARPALATPKHPCREMPTRHCPLIYGEVCGTRPCARFESSDESPWEAEVTGLWRAP